MPGKRFIWVLFVSACAFGAAHVSVKNELFGAGPTWIESEALYQESPAFLFPEPGGGDDVEPGKTPESPSPREEKKREEIPEPKSMKPVAPAEVEVEVAGPDDPRFPRSAREMGWTAFLEQCGFDYEVVPGDTLAGIGKKYSVPHELLSKMNALKPAELRAHSVIRVVRGPFHVIVSRKERSLRLYGGGL
ncbi:MAG: LysM peptidoglycan-binding domain-containing protein, partial [Planctomycetota bacterium]